MGLAVRAFVAPGEAALATRGTYPTFAYHVVGYGGRLIASHIATTARPTATRCWRSARRESPRIVYLANPDNPSGRFHRARRRWRGSTRRCRTTRSCCSTKRTPISSTRANCCRRHSKIGSIRLRTFSKAYGMAGARIGYALATERNVETFQKIRLHYGINRNAQVGALASLQRRRVSALRRRRDGARSRRVLALARRSVAATSSRARTSCASTSRRPSARRG